MLSSYSSHPPPPLPHRISTGDDHVPGDGYVTNVHFSLTGVEGTPPHEICEFVHVKEWDFKVCNLDGNLPTYLGGNLSCLPVLEEWDFSRNHMTGAWASPRVGGHWGSTDLGIAACRLGCVTLQAPASTGQGSREWVDALSMRVCTHACAGCHAWVPASSDGSCQQEPPKALLTMVSALRTGPIPESTGTIPRLVRLKMQGNHLTGSMPASMGGLKALEWIRVFGEGWAAGKGGD